MENENKKKKKTIKRRNDPKPSTSTPKVFEANKLQISEGDASMLIGSIIEKGMSENPQNKPFAPTPPPKPAVLPFPVARHRSHGPVSPFMFSVSFYFDLKSISI